MTALQQLPVRELKCQNRYRSEENRLNLVLYFLVNNNTHYVGI